MLNREKDYPSQSLLNKEAEELKKISLEALRIFTPWILTRITKPKPENLRLYGILKTLGVFRSK